jgi:hypothetical protein
MISVGFFAQPARKFAHRRWLYHVACPANLAGALARLLHSRVKGKTRDASNQFQTSRGDHEWLTELLKTALIVTPAGQTAQPNQ